MTKIFFSKNSIYNSKLVLIDGFSGSGKILVAELLKAIKNTEIVKLETSFDHLPIIFNRGKIEKSAAISLLKTIFDKHVYYTNIGREINLRRKDLTFALNHPNKFKYLSSMFGNPLNDDLITDQLSPKQIFPFMVHMSTFSNTLFEDGFHNINILYILRDPLFILETYSSYLNRISFDPREFTPKVNYNEKDIPWYAEEWAEEYLRINNTEKSIILIDKCLDILLKKLENNKMSKNIYKILFFEDLVSKIDKRFFEIESIFNQGYDKKYFNYIKRKNKVPRTSNQIVEGFWKRYTIKNVSRQGDNEEIILKRTKAMVSKYYFNKLSNLRDKYNNIKKTCLED